MFSAFSPIDDRPALFVTVDGETQQLSRRELLGAVAAHAKLLTRYGVRPGERVAVFTQRDIRTPVVLLTQALMGITTVPLNPQLGLQEREHILNDADPAVVFASLPEEVERGDVMVTPLPPLSSDPFEGALSDVFQKLPGDHTQLLVLYTSGTTGRPKGAVLTAGACLSNVDGLAQAWQLSSEDSIVHALPLFHVHGLVLGLLGAMRTGAAFHWVARFEPLDLAEALASHERGVLFGVPTMYGRLAEAADGDGANEKIVRDALAGARLLVSGSAALTTKLHERLHALTGQQIIERYGLTETLINTALPAGGARAGYVGPPVPGVELRLVDEDREPLDIHDDVTMGEIAVRGPNVFAGYLNRPRATAAVMDDEGWFYTGDLATRTADGCIRLLGRRATDLIKSGGYKVGAGEVEAAILEVEGVREAAVLGMPDEDLGERIVACVVVAQGATSRDALANEICESVGRSLSPHKRPREVHFVDELPRNAMGKVQKPKLRAVLEGDDATEGAP